MDHCEAPHCQALLQMIENAQRTIDFAIYGIRRQTAIFEALVAAQQRGVLVRGVVDRSPDGSNIYSDTDALVGALGHIKSDLKTEKKFAQDTRNFAPREPKCERPPGFEGPLQCLAYDLGDRCLLATHASREPLDDREAIMHHKFFVVDSQLVWTGSTNVSDSGTGGYNANVSAVIESPTIAKWYLDEFESMYSDGRFHTTKRKAAPRAVSLTAGDVEVLFSPQDSPIHTGVLPRLKGAQTSIDIAVFFLTDKFITEALIEAHQRGVVIRVILDATGASNGYTKHELLRAAGIPVKVESWGGKMHMKAAVIDNRTVIVGSMNWTSSGERVNDENTLIIDDPALATQFNSFFASIWASIPDRWQSHNPAPESRDSGHACEDGSDNDFDGQTDMNDPDCGPNPPPQPALPPWRIVDKGQRSFCDPSMDTL